MFVRTAVLRSIYLVVLIGTGTYLVLSTDLVLGILSLSFVPLAGWRATAARLQLRSSWFALQEKLSILSKVMDENLGGIRVVRSFASKTHEMDKFARASEDA